MPTNSPHGPQEGDVKQTKAIQRHAHRLYAALAELSEDEGTKKQPLLVFRGDKGNVFSSLNISQGYYSLAFKILEHNGCIEQLQRGSRGIDTVLVLLGCPDKPGDLEVPKVETAKGSLTDDPDFAKLSLRVQALEKLVGGLDIVSVLKNFEDRIQAQEKRGASNGKKS